MNPLAARNSNAGHKNRWRSGQLVFVYACAASIGLIYAVFLGIHLSNFPRGDDFLAILKPALEVAEKGWGAVSAESIFAQHYSHRIAPVRAIAMGEVLLLGHVNFTAFSWIGLISWYGSLTIIILHLKWWKSPPVLAAAALLWFQPLTADNITAPMQAASNLPIILLALGSFAARARNHWGSRTVAWLLGIMGVATTGNGFAIIAILILWDLATQRWKELGIGVFLLALVCYLYFNSFSNPSNQTFNSSIIDITGNAVVMLGAIFKFGTAPLGAAMVGGLILGVWSTVTCIHAIRGRHYFVAATLLFIGGSIAMAALARAGWGNEYMLQPRYMIYASIALTICVAYTLNYSSLPAAKLCLLVLCLVFHLAAWWHAAPAVINTYRTAIAESRSWAIGHPSHRFSGDLASNASGVAYAAAQLEKAHDRGIFTPAMTGLLAKGGEVAGKSLEVEAQWNTAAAGFIIDSPRPELEAHRMALVSVGKWNQFAFRPKSRFAIGRFLRGESQPPQPLIFAAPPYELPAEVRVLARPLFAK